MAVGTEEFADFTLERAMDAETVEVFSNRGGKLVELVRDEGVEFVRRIYMPDAVKEIEQVGVKFEEAFEAFAYMFEAAGLEIVDCALIESTLRSGKQRVIVAKYLGSLGIDTDIMTLPFAAKVELAGSMGRLLTSHPDYMPASQVFLTDAFAVDPTTSKAVLVDIDPYLKRRYTDRLGILDTEGSQGAILRICGRIITKWAVDDGERTAMASAYCRSAGHVITDDSSLELLGHFGYVHFMANGMSPEQLEGMGY
ncbi:hypothetical protein KC878_00860 [Candidatus Saccharibacteria bacterium]|nr:hypothetical protein [Candidatus Saccharibacteria bacterium]MCB9821488.1 hypothetical protein [Candidatus Nomurabacteria bacterium]